MPLPPRPPRALGILRDFLRDRKRRCKAEIWLVICQSGGWLGRSRPRVKILWWRFLVAEKFRTPRVSVSLGSISKLHHLPNTTAVLLERYSGCAVNQIRIMATSNPTSEDPLLRRLHQHIQELAQNPQLPVDDDLLALAAFDLPQRPPTVFTSAARQQLIVEIYQLLPLLQSPAQVVRLLSKLLESVPLAAILSLEPPVDFVAGLDVSATEFNLLTLLLLEKADEESAQRLATNHRAAFESLVILWLCTESTGVADAAGNTLIHLLTVGKDLVWKRMFRDKDVYEQIFAICHPKSKSPIALSRTRKTIAQARLLEWIPKAAALDWSAILSSHHPDVERSYGLKSGEGLLDFASVRMVDYKDDVLMHRSLIMFFSSILSKQADIGKRQSTSPALDFLASRKLHQRTLHIYVKPDDPKHDPVDITFLYTEAANYAATFTSTHPKAFLADKSARNQIVERLNAAFAIALSAWSTPSRSPAADLHVLSSLPRTALLPDRTTPLNLIPSNSPNADALKSLATVFHGPLSANPNEITFPPPASPPATDSSAADETALAHTLFNGYVSHHPSFWKDIIAHANRPSIPDAALAALALVKSVITADWDGVAAVMAPEARAIVVPYLLGLPNSSSSTVGSAGKDLQRIAEARQGVARALAEGLVGRDEWRDVGAALARRVTEGVWGSRVGVSIATLGGPS
jgi:hypothetical protein